MTAYFEISGILWHLFVAAAIRLSDFQGRKLFVTVILLVMMTTTKTFFEALSFTTPGVSDPSK